jgi:hypothetical protein
LAITQNWALSSDVAKSSRIIPAPIMARHAGFFHQHVDGEQPEPDPRKDDNNQPNT